jgi:hypothetical protein
MFHQNTAHQLRRYREEVGAVLPFHALVVHEAHVGFIYQRRRLEAVPGALAAHVAPCKSMEFVINNRGQFVERVPVSPTPSSEQPAHLHARCRFSVIILRLCCFSHSSTFLEILVP